MLILPEGIQVELKDEKKNLKPFSLTTNNDTKLNNSKEDYVKMNATDGGRSFDDNSS